MLVLTREQDTRVFITAANGDRITVAVQLRKGKIRLGIDAPAEYKILREEIENNGKV